MAARHPDARCTLWIAGCEDGRAVPPSVDPIELRLIVWKLRAGRYVEVADIGPDGEWTASQPFKLTIRPGELLDWTRSRSAERSIRYLLDRRLSALDPPDLGQRIVASG